MEAAGAQIYNLVERMKNSKRSIGRSLDRQPLCPKCNDLGFIEREGTAYMCSCARQREMERMFVSNEITPALKKMTFETFNPDRRSDQVKALRQTTLDYLANYPDGWLVLLGNSGCGKTHLSMAVMNCILSRGIQGLYFQHVDGMKELKGMLRRDDDSVNKRINQMQRVPLLVWDDLWKRKEDRDGNIDPTSFEFETVYDVLNYRWLNLLPTIISSERLPAELVKIDQAIGSRILERGKGYTVTVKGIENNYRLSGDD